ncbi:MAG: ribonuclease III [Ignavibacteria bacterium]|nr:ribonuclease III [Ignavibacteria bacterium]
MPKIISLLFSSIGKKKSKSELSRIHKPRFEKLEKIVGFKIKNKEIFLEAITHRSVSTKNQNYMKISSNERLEFLGDSVLNLIVGEFIFKKFNNEDEGFLTKLRAKLVNRDILISTAEKLKISDIMLMSENASLSLKEGAKSIISDAIEALIGAIYLEQGLEGARKFIMKNIVRLNKNLFYEQEDKNFKSQLLEYTQGKKLGTPDYKIIKEEGPQHARTFTIEVFINGKSFGIGVGKNKKSAEQSAAKNALVKIAKVSVK